MKLELEISDHLPDATIRAGAMFEAMGKTTISEQPKFWLVWGDGMQAPTFKHESMESALLEAARLSNRMNGHTFHVLEYRLSCRREGR